MLGNAPYPRAPATAGAAQEKVQRRRRVARRTKDAPAFDPRS